MRPAYIYRARDVKQLVADFDCDFFITLGRGDSDDH